MTRDALRKNAEEAWAALENDTLTEAFDVLDSVFVDCWREADTPEERERHFYRQQALAVVRSLLFEYLHAMAGFAERAGERGNIWRTRWQQAPQTPQTRQGRPA